MRESLGVEKPKGVMKVKTLVARVDGGCSVPALKGDDRTALRGRFICFCQRGAPRAYTLGPERW